MRLSKPFLMASAIAVILTGLPALSSDSTSNSVSAFAQTRARRRPATTNASLIRVGTNLRVRLEDRISSKDSRVGDRFVATVVQPSSYEGARVAGHISSIRRSGRVKGSTRIGLAFDRITLSNGRSGIMHGDVRRVYDSDSVQKVDEEGTVESGGRGKQTLKRSGIGAAAGAVLGGIVGGGKGAAIGLVVGGAAGAGSVAVTGSKDLTLEQGTEMLVRVIR